MNKQTEALKMAIAELEKGEGWMDNVSATIQACKEALEQPAQEPLMYGDAIHKGLSGACKPAQEPVAWIKEVELGYMKSNIAIGKMDYRTNLGLKPEPDDVPLYTHPAPSWQKLSDEEKLAIIRKWKDAHTMREQELIGLGDAIEQALKEKNT